MFNKDANIIPMFTTPVVLTNIGRDFTKDEIDCIENLPTSKNENGQIVMTNNRSDGFYLFDDFVELKNIKIFCEYHLKQYLEDIKGADTDLATLRITQSWLNKTKPGEYHNSHHHPNSYLSGVFYFSCLPNDHINFNNHLHGLYNNIEFSIKKLTAWNSTGTTINVKEGNLIIFPSWVAHHVDVNKTKNTDRVSLSFNTFPVGELGIGVTDYLKLM